MLFTSESVSPGHPDKVCDQISDAILDEALKQDKYAKVACETMACGNNIIIAGEINSKAKVDYQKVVFDTLKNIGIVNNEAEFKKWKLTILIQPQSQEIYNAVIEADDKPKELGAGDQGMMFGYACDDTKQLMPLPIQLAHALVKKATALIKTGKFKNGRYDMKSQVTVEYDKKNIPSIETVLMSIQHQENIDMDEFKQFVSKNIIDVVIKQYKVKKAKHFKLFINPSGSFVKGGPEADTGLTGRKIIVDTYGGWCPHGGGAFSGKDASKVDRSAAYMARFIAKNLVANKLAKKAQVQLSYAIGVAEPTSINVNTFGSSKLSEEKLIEIILKNFNLTPSGIIKQLDLLRPIYFETARFGHFGRDDLKLPWEKTFKLKA